MPTDVSLYQTRVNVHLLRQQPQPQQLLVESMEYSPESFVADSLDEVADGRVVEDLIVDSKEAEPSKCDVLRDGGTQSSERSDVV